MSRGKLKELSREEELKEASGNFALSGDPLTVFFYLLMRDHVPAGKVEMVVREVIEGAETMTFSNGFLAQYAQNLADELRDGRYRGLVTALDAAFTGPASQTKEAKEATESHLELTQEAAEVIDEAYEKMSEDERNKMERELDSGASDNMKVLAEKIEEVIDAVETGEDLDDDGLDHVERLKFMKKMIETEKLEDKIAISREEATKKELSSADENDPFSMKAINDRVADMEKPETSLQRKRKETSDAITKSEEVLRDTKKQAVESSLAAIDKLKDLVPSEAVNEVAKILRQEVEHELEENSELAAELQDAAASENLTPSGGVFRRVPSDLSIEDEDVAWTEKQE